MGNIKQIILEVAKKNKINLNIENVQEDLKSMGIDSLSAMNLIMKIEEKLNVQLPDEELLKIKKLGDLILAFEKEIKK